MKITIKVMLAVAVAALMISTGSSASAQASKGKILVVMSGGHILNLRDGKPYATGYYLNEVAYPFKH